MNKLRFVIKSDNHNCRIYTSKIVIFSNDFSGKIDLSDHGFLDNTKEKYIPICQRLKIKLILI